MADQDEQNRIHNLELRLARLEKVLYGLSRRMGVDPLELLPREDAPKPTALPVAQTEIQFPSSLAPAIAALRAQRAAENPNLDAAVPSATPAPARTITPPPPPVPMTTTQRPSTVSAGLEQDIGLKWAGWIGAVVLVISAGMGFVYAYEQGWFNHIPASLKLIVMALVGLTFIGAGEFVYRRVNQLASTGLFGAGISILFIVAYAGNHYYGLYPPGVAFWVMAHAVLLGALIAWRGKLLSIAVLSIVGGNLVPLLLSTGEQPGLTLLGYVLFLQVLALALSFVGGNPKWWTLRTLALISSTLWTLVVLSANTTATYTVLFIELLTAALFHSEAVVSSALRSARGSDGQPLQRSSVEKAAGVVFCLCVTIALCALGLVTLNDEPRKLKTTWVVALALFYGWQGLNLGAWFGERLKPHADGFKIQAALLLVLAVPVGLSGFWMTGAWGLLAVAFVALGARLKQPAARAFAALAMVLGLTKWFVWDTAFWCLDTAANASEPYIFNGYCGTALLLGLAGITSYLLLKRGAVEPPGTGVNLFPSALAYAPVALVFWAGSVEIHRYFAQLGNGAGTTGFDPALAEQMSLSLFWSLYALALIVAGFIFVRAAPRYAGLGLFMLTLIKVGVFDLSFLSQGYRILSFAGLGILLLATSVLYGYFSPKLLPKAEVAAGS